MEQGSRAVNLELVFDQLRALRARVAELEKSRDIADDRRVADRKQIEAIKAHAEEIDRRLTEFADSLEPLQRP